MAPGQGEVSCERRGGFPVARRWTATGVDGQSSTSAFAVSGVGRAEATASVSPGVGNSAHVAVGRLP